MIHYILCFIPTLIIVIRTEYIILDESGAEIGTLQYNSRLVKRDIVKPGHETIVQEDTHKYYNSKVLANSSAWIEINPNLSKLDKDTIHEGLSGTFRYAYNIHLPFTFPYYGLPLRTITPTTGGFVFVGELIHNQLTETQYIAPLMAEFNPSLSNDSFVYYYLTGTKAIIQWDHVYIHSEFDKESDQSWTDSGTRDVGITYATDIPLQIKTDSAFGSGDIMWIRFTDAKNDGPGFIVNFDSSPTYEVESCTSVKQTFSIPPSEKDNIRVWTITITERSLGVQCNGEDVINYLYSDSTKSGCLSEWPPKKDSQILFEKRDTASDQYRPKPTDKAFTFQVQLYINGDIIFAYKTVPYHPKNIDSSSHYVKVGIAEAFYEVDTSHGMTVTYIHQYHKIDIDFEHIKDESEVQILAERTCLMAESCAACGTIETNFNCSWCPGLQQCSDGVSRWRQNWKDANCDDVNVAIIDIDRCPNEIEAALPPKVESADGESKEPNEPLNSITKEHPDNAKTEPQNSANKPITEAKNAVEIVTKAPPEVDPPQAQGAVDDTAAAEALLGSSSSQLPNKGSYEMVMCQESKMAIVCAGNDKLAIESAEFSRKNYHGSFCESSKSKTGGDKCAYDKNLVFEKISKQCDDKTTCVINAAQSFFGADPCPGLDKTLNIYYKCSGSTSTAMKVFTGFIVVVVLALVLGFTVWVVYAYRNPTTPSGLWLIKYGRFWKSRSLYKEDTDESGI